MKSFNLGDNAIMFGNTKTCEYCKQQDHILKKSFNSGNYLYKQVTMGKPLKNGMKIKAIPTWYIPTGNGMGILHEGMINSQGIKIGKKRIHLRDLIKKTNRFGDTIPAINTLATDGKNFPDGKGFQIGNSFMTDITNKWGDPLLSGTLGREFGPGNTDKIYGNNYYNDIRMAYPGGDLDTTLSLNRSCNQYNAVGSPAADPVVNHAGMIYNSPNQQIVNMTGFGFARKRSGKSRRVASKKVLQKRRTKLKKLLQRKRRTVKQLSVFRKNKSKWKAELKRINKKLKKL